MPETPQMFRKIQETSETMSQTTVLSSKGPDREAWLQAWEESGREPFAHPAYVDLFKSRDEEACAVVAKTTQSLALLPLVLRPIPAHGRRSETALRDATSPYGYGGPYGEQDSVRNETWSGLAHWMPENEIVSMFGRLALEAPTPTHVPGATVTTDSDNVIVDLTRPAADQWRHYDHKVRKNVKKALRAGLHVDVKSSFTDLEEFSRLYELTMDRRKASPWYYFGLDFFVSLTEGLEGSYLAAETRDESGRLVSAELVLFSDRYLYSFLGGTRQDAFPHAPNDLLKHVLIEYGRETGRSGFVLGGGYTNNDGILRYKKAFDPTGSVPFRKLKLVADRVKYDLLVANRSRYARSIPSLAQLDESFFPAYRSELFYDVQQITGEGRH